MSTRSRREKKQRRKARQSDSDGAGDTYVPMGNLSFDTDDPEITGVRRRNKPKKFRYAPAEQDSQRRYTFTAGAQARTTMNYFWSLPPVNMAKYIASLASVVAIGAILVILGLWLTGWLPFYPTRLGQYAAVFVVIPLAIYIIGAAMWISDSMEFFVVSAVLQIFALATSTYMFASLFYLWYLCITSQTGGACVNPYYVDSAMFIILLIYWAAGLFATGAHIVVVARATRTTSVVDRYGPPG